MPPLARSAADLQPLAIAKRDSSTQIPNLVQPQLIKGKSNDLAAPDVSVYLTSTSWCYQVFSRALARSVHPVRYVRTESMVQILRSQSAIHAGCKWTLNRSHHVVEGNAVQFLLRRSLQLGGRSCSFGTLLVLGLFIRLCT